MEARLALYAIKKKLGAKVVQELVHDEVLEGDKYWHRTIAASKGDPVPLEVEIEALVSPHILNVTSFAGWLATFAPKGYPNRLVQGDPQHFFETIISTGGNTSEFVVTERWGTGPYTRFTSTPGKRMPFMKPKPEPPNAVQIFLNLVLHDGTVFAYAQQVYYDKPDGTGLVIDFTLWVPSATPRLLVEEMTSHVTVELSNWAEFAYEDIVSGRFAPNSPTQAGVGAGYLSFQPGEL
jgi:hypothetical protein